jgi:hypothetical protein
VKGHDVAHDQSELLLGFEESDGGFLDSSGTEEVPDGLFGR